ncbi:hypothetical protein L6452_43295 [Arctium lappa]|uniref:Uncharacterized protein n=1 Tax=Arctium lappa TaxID=4217 RepID=A0ACB8XK03_ARCLA|nr:hypothetical protein L6452_43295 [Arctium lappa]
MCLLFILFRPPALSSLSPPSTTVVLFCSTPPPPPFSLSIKISSDSGFISFRLSHFIAENPLKYKELNTFFLGVFRIVMCDPKLINLKNCLWF